jgi:hypothetical protein
MKVTETMELPLKYSLLCSPFMPPLNILKSGIGIPFTGTQFWGSYFTVTDFGYFGEIGHPHLMSGVGL